MVGLRLSFVTLALSPYALAAITVQKPGLSVPSEFAASKDAVKELFTNAFSAYTKFAFGHDDETQYASANLGFVAVTKSFVDGLGGWGASIVDGMDTMKIMGLDDLFEKALNFSQFIDFSQTGTGDTISVFESTIRYVGGLLSVYELNGNEPQFLVDQAESLAKKLALGFTGSSPIPWNSIDFGANQAATNSISNVAQAGTLTLEWSRLSKYTGNNTYRQLAENAVKHIAQLTPPLPGLPAQGIDPQSGNFSGAYVSWGGGTDSYLEYLLKYPRLNLDADPLFIQTWQTAVDSSIKWLLKTSTVGGWSYVADFQDDRQIRHIGSHLECFLGGNWILGGKLLNNDTILDIGLKLTDACFNTYVGTAYVFKLILQMIINIEYATRTGIGPEVFAFISEVTSQPPNGSDDGNFTGTPITPENLEFNNEHGFYIYDGESDYILRPEVMESNFYAWRVTGDVKYLQNAQSVIESYNKFLVVPGGEGGISGIFDVDNKAITDDTRIDDQESFLFAEVLKYLYLTFSDPSTLSLDEWVFNTECHPFRAPAIDTFGSPPPANPPFNAQKISPPTVPLPEISQNPQLSKVFRVNPQ
ncbi:hypothetical protein Clacol_009405 [Clathrus columnatus]|uniref:alpha-1,2-Mannosidase n=1 Tax=Clathrus columnatus TaxID=1419009 RepID=A0AAV5AT96_9AGAM|nr:hypothetical protein Clacol_009405 [Clathrus columnatus]